MKKRIALCGQICSGKSHYAKKISEECGNFKIISFAGKIKHFCKEIFGMNFKNRKLLINFAEKMKQIDENVWINLVKNDILDNDCIVIDDLRFKNEYEFLKRHGFMIVKIDINTQILSERIKKLYKSNYIDHINALSCESENTFKSFDVDFIIKNDEDFEILKSMIC